MSIAAILAQKEKPVYGLVLVVPLVDTCPDLAVDPWGQNPISFGLTTNRLLNELDERFGGLSGDRRNDWHYNPSKIPGKTIRKMGRITMIVSTFDVLLESQMRFRDQVKSSGPEVEWYQYDGLHMVNNMDQKTQAGRDVRHFLKYRFRVM